MSVSVTCHLSSVTKKLFSLLHNHLISIFCYSIISSSANPSSHFLLPHHRIFHHTIISFFVTPSSHVLLLHHIFFCNPVISSSIIHHHLFLCKPIISTSVTALSLLRYPIIHYHSLCSLSPHLLLFHSSLPLSSLHLFICCFIFSRSVTPLSLLPLLHYLSLC